MLEQKALDTATNGYLNGDIHQADLICRHLLSIGYDAPEVYCLLALISCDIGEIKFAKEYFLKSLAKAAPDNNDQGTLFPSLLSDIDLSPKDTSGCFSLSKDKQSNAFLLIKAWGFGFWADVDHVLGQLLLAEMTERTPIVHWGTNSLYNTKEDNNAFTMYFEPVSPFSVYDILNKGYSYYPPKWNDQNLLSNDNNKWSGPYSSMPGISFVNRAESVIVSDFHAAVNDLIPWIPGKHPLYGFGREKVYRYLVNKYLKLQPHLTEKIDAFYRENLQGRKPILAVHIRGGNKASEDREFNSIVDRYHDEINKYFTKDPDASIFLLTDDNRIVDNFNTQYPKKIITTDCTRTDYNYDTHYYEHDNPINLAMEVIRDTYLAAKCDHFIGYGWSNVSCMVNYIKNWPPDACTLLGENVNAARLFFSKNVNNGCNHFVPVKMLFNILKKS